MFVAFSYRTEDECSCHAVFYLSIMYVLGCVVEGKLVKEKLPPKTVSEAKPTQAAITSAIESVELVIRTYSVHSCKETRNAS